MPVTAETPDKLASYHRALAIARNIALGKVSTEEGAKDIMNYAVEEILRNKEQRQPDAA